MAFMIKGIIDLKGILFLMLLTVTSQATNLDCYGKAFHCVNSTHFMICVDLGRGISTTIDDVIIPCPSPTVCRITNRFECEFPVPFVPSSTATTTELATTLTTESEVITYAPLPTISVPFEEYFNTVSTTTLSQTELNPSSADTVLSVKPSIEGLDTSHLSTTEKVIAEKPILNDVNAIPDTAADGNFSSTVKPSNNIASNVTLNVNIIPDDVVSDNNSLITTSQAQVTERSKFDNEYNHFRNVTNEVTKTGSEQKEKSESVFTTEIGPPLEGTDIDISTQVDITNKITLSELTQNVKQINDSQSVGNIPKNAAGNFNNISEVLLVNASSIDVTSAVPEQIVNIAPDFTIGVQEVTENAAITALPNKTTHLESTQNVKKINASQSSRETIKHVTDNFSDVSVATTNVMSTAADHLDIGLTESSTLNSKQSTHGNETSPINTISELTGNTEPVLTKDFNKPSVSSTETTFFNTQASVNTISTDLTGAATEQTLINEQVSIKVLVEPSNVAVTDTFAIVTDTVSTVKKSPADIINASQSVNSIIDDNDPVSFFGTNETTTTTNNIIVTKNESDTLTTDLFVANNLENVTPVILASVETNTVSTTDNQNHQELYQTIAPAHSLSDSSLSIETANKDNKAIRRIIGASITDNVAILDITSTTVTIEKKISSKSIDQNHFNNNNVQTYQGNNIQGKLIDSNHDFSTTDSIVQDLVQTKPPLAIQNKSESGSITVGTAIVRTIIEEPLDTEILKRSESAISSTIESDSATEIVTTISFNNLEMIITNTSTSTPTLGTSTESIVNDPESDAESIGNAINNRTTNSTDRLIHNEKVLSTNDADNKPSTLAYNSNLSNKIKSSTISGLINEPSTINLELLPNEERTKTGIAIDTNKLSGMNIQSESGNKPSTESAILNTEAYLPKPAVNQSYILIKDINEIIGDTSTVPNDNISVAIIDEQAQTVTGRSSKSVHNVTDSSYENSLSSVTDKAILTGQHTVNVKGNEITTLHSPTATVNRNKNSSEPVKTLQQIGTIPINTSRSSSTLLSTTIAITEAAYVSLDYTYSEKTSFLDEAAITHTNNQTEIQTDTVILPTQSDVPSNIKENTHKSEIHSLTTEKLNNYDINKQNPTAATQTFSDMPLSTDPLESITPSIIENITIRTALESITTADKNNVYLSFSNDTLSHKASTTATDLLDSSTSNSDLIQNHIDQIYTAAQGMKNIKVTTDSSNISHNISYNVRSATYTSLKESTDSFTFNADNVNGTMIASMTESTDSFNFNADHVNETTMAASMTGSNFQKFTNPMENNLPTSNPPTKDLEKILYTTNTKTDSSLKLSTPENYRAIARSENNIRVTKDVPAIENTGTSTEQATVVNDGPTTESNILQNVLFNSPSSTFSTYTERDINVLSTTQINIKETASAATTEIPMVENTRNGDSMNEESSDVHLNSYYSIQQTNHKENITLNSSSVIVSNQELYTALHQTFTTTGEKNDGTSTSAMPLEPERDIETTFTTNSIIESSHTSTAEPKLNSQASSGLITSNLKKEENQKFIDYSRAQITILSPSSFIIPVTPPIQITTLSTSDNLNNIQNSLLTQTSGNLVPVNSNIANQFVTKSNEKEVSSISEISQILVNHNTTEVKSSAVIETFTFSDPVNSNLTKPILSSVTAPIDLDKLKQRDTTIPGARTDVLNAASTQPVNALQLSTISEVFLSQTEGLGSSVKSDQVSQTQPTIVAKSEISTDNAFFGTNRQVPLKKAGNIDRITNIEPTVVAVKRELVTDDDSQIFIDNNKNIKMAVTFSARQPTETTKRETNKNVEHIQSSTEKAMRSVTTKESTLQITESGVENIKDNNKSTSSVNLSNFSAPTEVITTSDVLVDSNIESENTHSGIISFIKQSPKPRESKEKKEKPETDVEEQQENPINEELASLQGSYTPPTDITVAPQKENRNIVEKYIGTREELLIKNVTNDFKTTNENKSEQRFSAKNNTNLNIHNSTNTAVSGYKKKTPTHELIENSTSSTNKSHTSNNKSQDQNMSIPQTHNKPVISYDQSSTSRYMSQTKSTAATDTQTTEFPASESTTRITEFNNICKQKKRGRYADELDCRKFYICLGNNSSHIIEGSCPVNTVFSEINKQCTKNLSHCIRNNQFRCVTEGRFSDFLNDNIYYICVRNNLIHFIRFKLQCQNGYHLNKTSVRCVLNTESTFTGESKSASEQSSSLIKQDITEKPEKVFKCKKTGVFPDPSNCKKYYECTKVDSSYRQKKKKCDSDEIFHKDKKKCVDGDSYEC